MATIQNQTSSDLIRSNLRGRRFTHRQFDRDLSDTEWQFHASKKFKGDSKASRLISDQQIPGGTGVTRLFPPGSKEFLSEGEYQAQQALAEEIALSLIPYNKAFRAIKWTGKATNRAIQAARKEFKIPPRKKGMSPERRKFIKDAAKVSSAAPIAIASEKFTPFLIKAAKKQILGSEKTKPGPRRDYSRRELLPHMAFHER